MNSARIQKPGLALAGFTEHVHQERVQILGLTELSFLETRIGSQMATCSAGLRHCRAAH